MDDNSSINGIKIVSFKTSETKIKMIMDISVIDAREFIKKTSFGLPSNSRFNKILTDKMQLEISKTLDSMGGHS